MKNYFLFILLGSLLLNSCKKEKAVDVPALDGRWQTVDVYGSLSGEYYLFNVSTKTVYNFSKDGNDFRNFDKGVFNLKDELLEMNLSGTKLYTYSVVNDTLTLTEPHYGAVTKMVRDNLAPASADAWIKPATLLTQFTDSFRSEGMTIYNGKIYSIISSSLKRMKVFDLATLSVDNNVDLSDEYSSCEFVGNKLWVARKSDNKLDQIDYVNGSVLFTSIASGVFSNIRGLANTGISLAGLAGSSLVFYSTGSNTFTTSSNTANNVYDMAYSNGKYYVVTNNKVIHQINMSDLREEKSWRIENFNMDGIAFNGTDCWVHGNKTSDLFTTYMKVSLP
jgi:hypothetical protein